MVKQRFASVSTRTFWILLKPAQQLNLKRIWHCGDYLFSDLFDLHNPYFPLVAVPPGLRASLESILSWRKNAA